MEKTIIPQGILKVYLIYIVYTHIYIYKVYPLTKM